MINLKNAKSRSFYISLTVCMIMVLAASWSTYKSMKDFSFSKDRKTASTSNKKNKTPEEIPKSIKTDVEPSPKPVQNKIQDKKIDIEAHKNENTKAVSASVAYPDFLAPIEYSKFTKFSNELSFSEKFQDWRTDDGIDLEGKHGADVRTVSEGKVIDIFDDPTYGTTLKLEHPNGNSKVNVYYSGLNSRTFTVKKNDIVGKGQKLGNLLENNLHLMTQVNGKFIDPKEIIFME
ncbi:MAG: M23 family metallopeptidase [Firmicutes bacterium]|nr:M23 family metallopeptidase [Bacillota bacterium]